MGNVIIKCQTLRWLAGRFEYDGELNPHFSAGRFSLPVASIRAVLPKPLAPRLVHVSSAGACHIKMHCSRLLLHAVRSIVARAVLDRLLVDVGMIL